MDYQYGDRIERQHIGEDLAAVCEMSVHRQVLGQCGTEMPITKDTENSTEQHRQEDPVPACDGQCCAEFGCRYF